MFDKSLSDYPDKVILVADLVKMANNKDMYIIFECDNSDEYLTTLYEGRAEYLKCSAEGTCHEVCDRVVTWVDADEGNIILYVQQHEVK